MNINKTEKNEIGIFSNMIASGPVIIQKRDGKLKTLLVKHGDKPITELKWKFCGGRVVKDTGLRENAIRRAKEEIGIEVKIIKALEPLVLWNEKPEVDAGKPEAIILIHYLAEITAEPNGNRESEIMDWFDINDLPNDCAPNVKPVIDKYLELE
jgi:ADP-ribose pyrophosphatase YjhB (NUDIX family)